MIEKIKSQFGGKTVPLGIIRVSIALFLSAHGWSRLLTGGVVPFGGFLEQIGLPFGVVVAGFITAVEIVGTVFFAFRKFVLPLGIWFIAVLAGGIFTVHGQHGWFVVGRTLNGMEYSSFLIISILAILLAERKRETS